MKSYYLIFLLVLLPVILAKKSDDKPDWAKKDIRDYTEADMERLLEQWEEDDDPLEPDELPEYKRPPPKIDFSKIPSDNPEDLLKLTKKGRTLMMFVSVTGNPTQEESNTITTLWQTSLWNNHIQAERYMVDTARAIFLFKDGEQAWEAKDFLVQQERCKGVTIDNKEYPGVYASKEKDEL